jgi:hypothetical protein
MLILASWNFALHRDLAEIRVTMSERRLESSDELKKYEAEIADLRKTHAESVLETSRHLEDQTPDRKLGGGSGEAGLEPVIDVQVSSSTHHSPLDYKSRAHLPLD